MNYIRLTPENLEKEHICCAISSNKDPQVLSKKEWLRNQISDGLVFLKADARGKCFIEYVPAENAWLPIEAKNYMHINCLWVSGSFKGHGYADELLESCIHDAKEKEKSGITVISSPKKMPFLSDPKYLIYKGFQIADMAEPHFNLMYLPFDESSEIPRWKEHVKVPKTKDLGFILYYTYGCPFTAKYVPLVENTAKTLGIPFKSIRIDNCEEAQNSPAPWTNYALFYNGKYITNEILSEKKFTSICMKLTGGEM